METANRPVTDLSDVVAKEIRVLLVRRDMKQTELAAKLGVSEMWLSRRLRGAQPLDLNDLQRIAAVLNVEAADLLPRSNEGRIITTAGSGVAHNHGSGRPAKRRMEKRSPRHPYPIGRTHSGPTSPTPAEPPSQRRPAVISAAG